MLLLGVKGVVRGADPSEVYGRVANYVAGPEKETKNAHGRKLMNPSSFKGEAGKWEEYAIYWERLVEWNGWTEDIATDALMLSLSGDVTM